jgi:flagellar basal-body rod modification protein FlgD
MRKEKNPVTVQSLALDHIAGLSQAGTSSQETGNKAELGRDEFLKLLITQLKHQDPLNPMQSVEFTAQLAQFSSLEQLFNLGDSLEGIKTSLLLQEGDRLVHYIGKSVKTSGNGVAVQGGEPEKASYRLEEDGEVWVDVYDGKGVLVRNLYAGWQQRGDHAVPWDGRDGAGNKVADGNYVFKVEARDLNGYSVPSQSYMSGEVTGVKYENGQGFLLLGEKLVPPYSIIEVNQL